MASGYGNHWRFCYFNCKIVRSGSPTFPVTHGGTDSFILKASTLSLTSHIDIVRYDVCIRHAYRKTYVQYPVSSTFIQGFLLIFVWKSASFYSGIYSNEYISFDLWKFTWGTVPTKLEKNFSLPISVDRDSSGEAEADGGDEERVGHHLGQGSNRQARPSSLSHRSGHFTLQCSCQVNPIDVAYTTF